MEVEQEVVILVLVEQQEVINIKNPKFSGFFVTINYLYRIKIKISIMINKTFINNKYCRTYIGGSKLKELEIFLKVQNIKNKSNNCNWLEYRKILTAYIEDKLHILFSWKQLLHKIGYTLLIISIVLFNHKIIITITLSLSIITFIVGSILNKYLQHKIKEYNMCLNITLNEIYKQTGFKLNN